MMKAIRYNKKALPGKLTYRDIEKSVVDTCYSPDKTAEAMLYLARHHRKMNKKSVASCISRRHFLF